MQLFQEVAELCGVTDCACGDLHAWNSLVMYAYGCVKLQVFSSRLVLSP
jgi:hypothetical protein